MPVQKRPNFFGNNRGITLIEMLVALAIFGVAVMAAVALFENQSSMGARSQGRTSNIFFQQAANTIMADSNRCKTGVKFLTPIPAVIAPGSSFAMEIDTESSGHFWQAGDKPTGYPNFQVTALNLKNLVDMGYNLSGEHAFAGVVVMGGQSFSGGSQQVSPPVTIGPFYASVDAASSIVACGQTPLSNTIYKEINALTYNYNLFVEVGSPPSPVKVVLTVNSGVFVCSHSVNNPSLETGSFPAGSKITIINKGTIEGHGGDGGGSSLPGGFGGPAMKLSHPIVLDNQGAINGGGGGGGGGGPNYVFGGIPGGGGGGGQGCDPGNGGVGGGGGGGAGTPTSPGGAGGIWGITFFGGSGGGSGAGSWAGLSGTGWWPVLGPGGATGAAIETNGHAIVWKNHGTVNP